MSGIKKTFRLNPMVGAPLRRPPRRRLPRALHRRTRRAFVIAWLAAGCALAATMFVADLAWGGPRGAETSRGSSCMSAA